LNFQFMLANLAIHNVRNVSPISCAAGSKPGSLTLYRSYYNSGDHRLTPFEDARSTVEVRVRRLDDLLAGTAFDAVLIDTQGWDNEVVAGMAQLLEGLPPMVVELTTAWLRERGIDPVVVVEGYRQLGYHVGVPWMDIPLGAGAAEVVAAVDSQEHAFANLELRAATRRY
jgi:FkbM family methyltransferase